MKICVVASVPAATEPRAPRHALAAKRAFPDAEVVFLELEAAGAPAPDPAYLAGAPLTRRKTLFPTRRCGLLALAWRKLLVKAARIAERLFGRITPAIFGDRVVGLERALRAERADVYFAHNIETLLPAARAASARGALLMFDCMEYYSDMGDAQTPAEARAARRLQDVWLPRCDLVTASSQALAEALAREHRIPPPLALYNTPSLTAPPPPMSDRGEGLTLYWRNGVVGLGQRGLDDALVALKSLPEDVILSVQGRLPSDGGAALRARIAALGLERRVRLLPPFAAGGAVAEAQKHMVGLCLERRGPANHEFTVSNKLFDYLMAGMAVVVSDLPSLRAVVDQSGGGLLFTPGSPDDLAAKLMDLYGDPPRLARFGQAARAFAETTGNVEVDVARLEGALKGIIGARSL